MPSGLPYPDNSREGGLPCIYPTVPLLSSYYGTFGSGRRDVPIPLPDIYYYPPATLLCQMFVVWNVSWALFWRAGMPYPPWFCLPPAITGLTQSPQTPCSEPVLAGLGEHCARLPRYLGPTDVDSQVAPPPPPHPYSAIVVEPGLTGQYLPTPTTFPVCLVGVVVLFCQTKRAVFQAGRQGQNLPCPLLYYSPTHPTIQFWANDRQACVAISLTTQPTLL